MKLRLQSNSVRLRLKRGEVAQMLERGEVRETIVFGDADEDVLLYTLESSHHLSAPRASLSARHVRVEIPRETVSHWATGDDIGIEATHQLGGGRELHILVEKDFACLDGTEEQNEDTFPNPLAGCT